MSRQWLIQLQDRSRIMRNTGIITMCILLVAQVVWLVDFLPKLTTVPEAFPRLSNCIGIDFQITHNLCSVSYAAEFGGIASTWQNCFIAKLIFNYTTDEAVLDFNASQNPIAGSLANYKPRTGTCVFNYPESFAEPLALLQRVPSLLVNQSCWVNILQDECYVVDLAQIKTVFLQVQYTLLVLWIILIIFVWSMHRIYTNRHDYGLWYLDQAMIA